MFTKWAKNVVRSGKSKQVTIQITIKRKEESNHIQEHEDVSGSASMLTSAKEENSHRSVSSHYT